MENTTVKKKSVLFLHIAVVCLIGVFVYFSNSSPKGNTVESREALLDSAITKGDDWTILK